MTHEFPFPRFEGLLQRIYAVLVYRRKCRYFGKGASISPFATVTGLEHLAIGAGSYVGRRSLLAITPNPQASHHGDANASALEIGDNTYIGRGCTLSACGKLAIGRDVTLGDNVYISAGQHGFADPGTRVLEQPMSPGQVMIENGAWIGYGAFISTTSQLTIGKCAIVAAGAVVTKSVPAYTMVGGVPARPIKRFDADRREWLAIAEAEKMS